jgi:hypothetical protein
MPGRTTGTGTGPLSNNIFRQLMVHNMRLPVVLESVKHFQIWHNIQQNIAALPI